MIHIGRNTTSTIVSKGISAGKAPSTYRGLGKVLRSATGARNHTQCDSLLLGSECGAHAFPSVQGTQHPAELELDATPSAIHEAQPSSARPRALGTAPGRRKRRT